MKRADKQIKNIYEAPLVIVLFILVFYFIFGNGILIKIAFLIGFLSLLFKRLAIILGYIWRRILKTLGFINAHVLLSLVFILVLMPVSFLYKLSNKDPLNLKGGKDSYFIVRNHQFEPKDLENPW